MRFNIWKEGGVKLEKEHWYENLPKSVEIAHENSVTIQWNEQMKSDRTISNNTPDIIIRGN